MKKPTLKQIIYIIAGIIIIAFIVYGFIPGAEHVETAKVERGDLQVTVEEEGETIVKQLYTISSPVSAYMNRIDFEPGDSVNLGNELITFRSMEPSPLDARSREEALARVEAARSALQRSEVNAELATNERNRIERLAENGSATNQQVEQAQAEAVQATSALESARAELRSAQAAIQSYNQGTEITSTVQSPISGYVLSIHRKSEGPVTAGEPIIDIGNTDSLEVKVDILSQDAILIQPGTRVELDQWGGDTTLDAIVTRVEKQGKVVVSALGVEERRVQVTAKLEASQEEYSHGLGSGYRVMATFIIWEESDVLQIPEAAIFRTEDGWAVFTIEDGRAVSKTVTPGRNAGLRTQILDGLSEDETVIVHPGRNISEGTKVETE